MLRERIAIVAGTRSPFSKAFGALKDISAADLGAAVVRELMMTTNLSQDLIDEVIIGNVGNPAGSMNMARVVSLRAGLDDSIPAYTVHRNCASGMESITTAACKILAGQGEVFIAGGTESMSQFPFYFRPVMQAFFMKMMRAKTIVQKLKLLTEFRLKHLKPIVGIEVGLTDPVCGLNMGQTAEVLSKEFHIDRISQDQFALTSHQKSIAARERLQEEILPIPCPPRFDKTLEVDDGPREEQTLEQLQKLRPYFDRQSGSVTVGNACPITDGAAAVLVMSESKAKELDLSPLGYLKAFSYAGLDGSRMGLGPVYATAKVCSSNSFSVKDFDLIELNEAFAAQVLANIKAFDSDDFSKKYLNRDKSLGPIDPDILNVNGGAIALGHPVGVSGTRLVLTLLKELRRRQKNLGLATLCIGGGQGASLVLEVA